jgi:hypothetical protein
MHIEANDLIDGMDWNNITNELHLNFTDETLAGGFRISFNGVLDEGPYLPGLPLKRLSRAVNFPVNIFAEDSNEEEKKGEIDAKTLAAIQAALLKKGNNNKNADSVKLALATGVTVKTVRMTMYGEFSIIFNKELADIDVKTFSKTPVKLSAFQLSKAEVKL